MTENVQRIRYGPNEVLDQVETRERIWNPDTLDWEAKTTTEHETMEEQLVLNRRLNEEILITLKEINEKIGGIK